MTVQLAVLSVALAAFSAHDIWKRTIPPWLLGIVALGVSLGDWTGWVTWWWTSAVLGALIFWVGGLPKGDRAGIFLVAGLLPPLEAALVVWGSGLAGICYVYLIGRFRSMIGFPFFPAVAICASVVAWMTS
jgi:hypothetical protein